MPVAIRIAMIVPLLVALSTLAAEAQEGASGGSEEQAGTGSIVAYQVGAFLNKSNAERLNAELFSRGFYGTIVQKSVHGKDFWAVMVAAPPNPFENFQDELIAAGYTSFPIR